MLLRSDTQQKGRFVKILWCVLICFIHWTWTFRTAHESGKNDGVTVLKAGGQGLHMGLMAMCLPAIISFNLNNEPIFQSNLTHKETN